METTALGAAYRRAWRSVSGRTGAEIAALWQRDRTFEPAMGADERQARLCGMAGCGAPPALPTWLIAPASRAGARRARGTNLRRASGIDHAVAARAGQDGQRCPWKPSRRRACHQVWRWCQAPVTHTVPLHTRIRATERSAMRHATFTAVVGLIFAGGAIDAIADTTYDAAAAFSQAPAAFAQATNPNGVWSYGSLPSSVTPATALSVFTEHLTINGLLGWRRNETSREHPALFQSVDDHHVSGQPEDIRPGELSCAPGTVSNVCCDSPPGSPGAIRWPRHSKD